jgi:hypothetical protein
MSYTTRAGIEIIDNELVPDGEIWISAPGPEGMKIQYMFRLVDHAISLQPPGKTGFLASVDAMVTNLVELAADGDLEATRFAAEALKQHIADYRAGKEPEIDPDSGFPAWMAKLLNERTPDAI